MTKEQLGEIAYKAYCQEREWRSVRGEPLPHWNEQDQHLRDAWAKAADAVAFTLRSLVAPG